MDYIVLDLEWNQSVDGKAGENKKLPFEIIEIGAVKLNKDKEVVGEFSELIKPKVYHQMHHITKKLIHIQMKELEKGRPFLEVMKEFLVWCGEDYIFATWGSLDLLELQRNMEFYGMEPLSKGPLRFLDIQKLFSLAYEENKKEYKALEYAVDFLKIEKDIPFHRAFSDAFYTAKVFRHIQDEDIESHFSYDLYQIPRTKEEEIKVTFSDYSKYITRPFKDKAEALADKEVSSTRCHICNKNARKKLRWFTPNGKHYYCVSYCRNHGYIKGKIRIKKWEKGKIYVVKTLKMISLEQAEDIKERQTHAREQRKLKKQQQKIRKRQSNNTK